MILSLIMGLLLTTASYLVTFAQAQPYYLVVSRDALHLGLALSYQGNTSSPSLTSNPTLSLLSTKDDDEAGDRHLTKVIGTLFLFLAFASVVFCVYFFGPSLRLRLLNMSASKIGKAGFGFNKLTKKGLEWRKRANGKVMAREWFIRLPEKPPALVLKQELPLPPIEILVDKQVVKG